MSRWSADSLKLTAAYSNDLNMTHSPIFMIQMYTSVNKEKSVKKKAVIKMGRATIIVSELATSHTHTELTSIERKREIQRKANEEHSHPLRSFLSQLRSRMA